MERTEGTEGMEGAKREMKTTHRGGGERMMLDSDLFAPPTGQLFLSRRLIGWLSVVRLLMIGWVDTDLLNLRRRP